MTSRHAASADGLPTGSRIASFEIKAVIARGPTSFVYLAHDLTRGMPVAIKEYAPARRIGAARSEVIDPLVQRGLQAFLAESRVLAACHHPSLVRVEALLDANGTAYRVMPFYKGLSLVHVRTSLGRAPDGATLRAWGSDLSGALQALHGSGHAHGGVSPDNILLLADDRPLLFGAGSASHRVGSDLVESLLADFGLRSPAATHGEPEAKFSAAATSNAATHALPNPGAAPAEAVADDLRALAAVLRFCVSGEAMAKAVPPTDPAPPVADRSGVAAMPPAPMWADPPVPSKVAAQSSVLPTPPAPPTPPMPGRWFAEHGQLEGAGDDHFIGASEPTFGHDLQLEDGAATEADLPGPPVVPAPASTARPFIPVRWHIPLWVGLIALVAVAVVGVMGQVMGAWNRMPVMAFDRSLQTVPLPSTAPAASRPSQTPPRGQAEFDQTSAATVAAAPAPAPAPTSAPAPAPASASAPAAALSAAAAAAEAAQAPGLLTGPSNALTAGSTAAALPTAKKTDNKTPQKTANGAAKKPVAKPLAQPVPPAQPKPPAQPAVVPRVVSPLAACGARTNFALEHCMQNQCRSKRWASHPQCTSRAAA